MKREARRETVSRTPERRRRVRASVWKKKRSSRVRELLAAARSPSPRAARSLTPPSPRGRLARRWTRDEVRRVSRFGAGPSPSFDTRHAPRAPPSPSPRDHLAVLDATSDGRAIHQRGVAGLHHRAARPISRGENEFSVGVFPGDVREGGPGDVGGEASAGVDVEDEGVRSASRAHATDDGARARALAAATERGRARARGGRAGTWQVLDGSHRPRRFVSRTLPVARRRRARARGAGRPAFLVVVVVFVVERASNIRRGVRAEARTSERDGRVRRRVDVVLRAHLAVSRRRGRGRLHRRGERRLLLPGPRRGHERCAPKWRGRSPRHQTRVSTCGPVDGDVRDEVQTNVLVDGRGGPRGERKRKRTGGGRVARRRRLNHERRGVSSPSGSDGSSKTNAAGNRSPRRTFGSDRATDGEVAFPREATSATARSRLGRSGTRNAATDGPREGRSRAGRGRGAGARGEARVSERRDAGSGVEVVGDVDGGDPPRRSRRRKRVPKATGGSSSWTAPARPEARRATRPGRKNAG